MHNVAKLKARIAEVASELEAGKETRERLIAERNEIVVILANHSNLTWLQIADLAGISSAQVGNVLNGDMGGKRFRARDRAIEARSKRK